jgi:uncharacterized protein YabE (DUF348 family)
MELYRRPIVDIWEATDMSLREALRRSSLKLAAVGLLLTLFLAACNPPQVKQGQITVTVNTVEGSSTVKVAAGSPVQDAINAAKITLGELDRSEPPLYTILADGSKVQVIKVAE